MKITKEETDKIKNIGAEDFQKKIYPRLSKKYFNKLLVRYVDRKQAIDILRDYKKRGMQKEYDIFCKLWNKKKKEDIEQYL